MTDPMHGGGLCPRRDDVVAHYLDGEVVAAHVRGELDEHAAECDDCRRALARARRLDALVAATAAPADAEQAELLIDRALAATAPPSVGTAAGRLWRAAAAAALVALGVAIGFGLFAGRPAERSRQPYPVGPRDPVSTSAGTGGDRSTLPPGSIPLPERGAPFRPESRIRVAEVDTLQGILTSGGLAAWAWGWVGVRDGVRAAPRSVHRLADAVRTEAARRLLRASTDEACDRTVALLAALGSGPSFDALRTCARGDSNFQGRLARGVARSEERAVHAAAIVGGERLDAALRALVGGDRDRAVVLAARLRGTPERPGRAELLLAVWGDVAARGGAADDLAELLFAGLGRADTAAMVRSLSRSSNGAERARCLRALASLRDAAASDELCRVLEGSNRDEAALAAFALGRVAAGEDDLAERRVDARGRPWWCAALASRGDPRAGREIARLSVSADEKAFLTAGGFTAEQTSIAARLFRERRGRID